jgi:enamine deaminase RidA (YjgF/YER057c/UK114 family)
MSERKLRARGGAAPAPKSAVRHDPVLLKKTGATPEQRSGSHVASGSREGVSWRSFTGENGSTEHFFMIDAPAGVSFTAQLAELQVRYAAALKRCNLSAQTAVFRRIFLSDILNQADTLCDSPLVEGIGENPVSTSIIQQLPLSGSKVALLAYHIESKTPIEKEFIGPRHLLIKKDGLRYLWSAGPWVDGKPTLPAPAAETRAVFDELIAVLGDQGATLEGNCVRTWLFIKDVDIFYQDMVTSRRELFDANGLTQQTHYIASTGIEGTSADRFDTICMDALSLLDLKPEQVFYLNDLDRLCLTKDYGVTFERGTRIGFADRMHHYISGTASIDNRGNVLHLGDVLAQTEVAIENVDALLKSGGASMDDMMYLIVYLRDPADFPSVSRFLRDTLPNLPFIVVQGRVCRPEWLVEVEGIAVAPNRDPSLPSF